MAECEVCKRKFSETKQLRQHIVDSLERSRKHEALCCLRCNSRPFTSSLAKQQHLIASDEHRICHICPEFWDYDTEKKIELHFKLHHFGLTPLKSQLPKDGTLIVTDAGGMGAAPSNAAPSNVGPTRKTKKKAVKPPPTPLDRFFKSFESFSYDPALPPTDSYQNLLDHFRWAANSREAQKARDEYRAALKTEVSVWFGREDDLEAWHTVCRAVGIHDPPASITKCKQALRRTHVNITDLVQWGRSGGTHPVRVFGTVRELVQYSVEQNKVYPKKHLKGQGSKGDQKNVVLRHLLRHFLP